MEALKQETTQNVTEVTERAAFLALQPEWDALAAAVGGGLFLRHDFLRIWVNNFAPEASLRVLLLRDADGKLEAALALMEERSSLYGIPVKQLVAPANPHSCRFDVLARNPAKAAERFLSYLHTDPSWDLIRIIDVPEGGSGFGLLEAARTAGMPTGTWASLSSPYIPLPPTFEAMQERLTTKFKANLRRRRKKLEEKGKVSFERVEGGELLARALEEGFELEKSGWKGERGTAMSQDVATRGFYTELARNAAYRGELSLYFLRLDGRPVAFHYGLTVGKTYLLLKPGYDETLKECSPGQLLMDEVLKDCVARGLTEFDFLGPDMVWKRDWTDKVRPHTWLFLFRDSRFGRALCRAKFDWVPKAKEVVARWKK